VVEATQPRPFEMPFPHLLFEILIIALDAPSSLVRITSFPKDDRFLLRNVEAIFGRLVLTFWPFRSQAILFFRSAFR